MIQVRYAERSDLKSVTADGYVAEEVVSRKIEAGEVVVAALGAMIVGYARIEYLWSKLPYLALIHVAPPYRRRGVSRTLLAFVERELSAAGHPFLLSSSQADEPEPQAWHRHMGFRDCGRIDGINAGGVDELFYRKDLTPAGGRAGGDGG